jgi:hypothetical protein
MTELLPTRAFSAPWRTGAYPISAHERAGPLWTSPPRGVVRSALLDGSAPLSRIQAAAAAVQGIPLGTWAAAYMHGAADLDGFDLDGSTPQPVVFCPGRSGRRAPRPGLRPLRSRLSADDVARVRGVPVTSAVRTAFDLGRTAPDVESAVADVDALLRACTISLETVADYAADRAGWKGVPLLRAALPLVDPRSRSRPESRMRVVWIRDAGLARPEVNVPVHSRRDGRLLGIPDLLDVTTGLVGEYDGGQHREVQQHGADNVREELLERHGLIVVRAMWKDVNEKRGLVRRLRWGAAQAREQRRRDWYVPPSAVRHS